MSAVEKNANQIVLTTNFFFNHDDMTRFIIV